MQTGGQATCKGDSGGPMFKYEFFNGTEYKRRYIQIGTVHGSVESCKDRFPGIYVRLEDPSIFAFVKSSGKVNGNLFYTAPKEGLF